MSKQETVEVKFNQKFYESIQKLLEENPWLGFGSVEEFVEDAVKWRMEQLTYLEAKRREARKK